MRVTGAALLFYVGLPLMALFGSELPPAADMKVDFDQHVKPILAKNCHACHGTKQQQSGLRLDKRQNALRGGDYGPVIIAGKSADSKLILRLVSGDGGMQMPPTGPLAAEDIGILRAWIDQGAEWGDIELQCCPGKVAPSDGESRPLNVLWPVLPGNDLKSRGRKWSPERSIRTRHNEG